MERACVVRFFFSDPFQSGDGAKLRPSFGRLKGTSRKKKINQTIKTGINANEDFI
ncbi:hypothetical protein G210_0392 [Candida maltosa Xu316]|uniref:Uncharacterized protein n=1 Tax=Candida maltosa (strain Xu316) TaxID=1245528 RepID=M3K2H5_CANMX|nr:hypothetical protein G210_0392 [Candida maltosa Xu316]